ncbi:DUF6701 domain-containing protein [Vibrio alfacsensis]|uniref:DUF6701 domain-containing protein n=1 Tax=Vibrio alfacsensis TaxID=1074311 RepID=UPI002ADE398E|nr:DUF6701 domain-containing protein [Vibrio alfacsensis]WQE75900.1 DUF6701 domain-containing protein [Vibrio alfacsensis]
MKIINTIFALMLLIPSIATANPKGHGSCSVKGQDDFTIKFDVRGKAQYQDLSLGQGNHGYVLWYTKNKQSNSSYIFNEPNLQNRVHYDVKITHQANSGLLKYYRKLDDASSYTLIESTNFTLKSGQYWVVSNSAGVDDIECSNYVDPVEPVDPINRSPDFEFGTVDRGTCRMEGGKYTCTIHFENSYDASKPKPLVFVMPTIDASLSKKSPRTTEYPSSISVVDTSHSSATIVQEFAPHRKADSNVTFLGKNDNAVQKELANVDYFVIEPGVLELNNGSKIVAGTIDTDVAASEEKSERNNGVTIDFADFGLNHFDKIPGVLVQSQTRNNDRSSDWFTALARDVTEDKAKISLETSEVYSNLRTKETLAFVAGQGAGYINGRKFWLGDGTTKYTLQADDPVIDPVVEGCSVYTPFPDGTSFDEPPILVANKNSRRGPNGGWLKRCDVTNNSAAFIIEEDMQKDKERGHKDEDVGWFMFEKANPNPICNAFNNAPVQTWKRERPEDGPNGTLFLSNQSKILGAPILTVDGERMRVVGFRPGSISGQNRTNACDGFECHGDDGLLVGKEALEDFPVTTTWSNATIGANQKVTYQNGKRVKNLNVDGELTLEAGQYWFDTVKINTGGKLLVKEGTEVTINTKAVALANKSFMGMDVNLNPLSTINGNMRVNVYDLPISTTTLYDRVDIANHSEFVGLIYSEKKVYLSNHSTVYGAVTAVDIDMNNHTTVHAATSCLPSLDDYEFNMSPKTQFALMCGDDKPEFTIETKNKGEPESTWIDVEMLPVNMASNFTVTVANNTGTGSYPRFRTSVNDDNRGQLDLVVTVKNTAQVDLNQTFSLKATMVEDDNQTQTTTFKYVPFKFAVDDISVVAGKSYKLDTKVLACHGDEQTVVKSYTGLPVVTLDLEAPSSGRNDDNLLTYAPEFLSLEKGVSNDDFKLMESGQYTIKLEDANFTCDPQYSDKCPISSDGDIESQAKTSILNGSFTVQSRPWKIAACDIVAKNDGKLNPETQDTDSGFIPSGESFSVTYKPVVHSDSKGQASDLCNYPVTQNFFSDDPLSGEGAKAQFDTEFSIVYPSSTDSDIANLGDKQQLEFNKDNAKSGLTVEYAWNEVGSLDLKTSGTYFQKSLTDNHVTIGRFYPKYFQVIDSDWNYPGAQNFAYMGQPFDGVSYSVEALNSNEDSLKNYALFESANQAMFNIDELDALAGRFDAPSSEGSWGLSDNTKSLGSFTIGGNSLCGADSSNRSVGSACFIKDFTKINDAKGYADGPYNQGSDVTKIGLVFAGNSQDPVSFLNIDKANDSRLIIQPKIRFGRVNLSDAGEKQGKDTVIHIPLRIEYWDGKRFTLNLDDSQTDVAGLKSPKPEYEDKTIWSDKKNQSGEYEAVDVALSAGGKVIAGRSRSIEATEAESNRQQSRVWLDLDPSGNDLPWLKYNWDKTESGEENPSSVVTFGIHRGNDRVIYRGEPGLTAQ